MRMLGHNEVHLSADVFCRNCDTKHCFFIKTLVRWQNVFIIMFVNAKYSFTRCSQSLSRFK